MGQKGIEPGILEDHAASVSISAKDAGEGHMSLKEAPWMPGAGPERRAR